MWGLEGGFAGSLWGNASCSFVSIQEGTCPGPWFAFKTWGTSVPGVREGEAGGAVNQTPVSHGCLPYREPGWDPCHPSKPVNAGFP